jgi:hypothetical protein
MLCGSADLRTNPEDLLAAADLTNLYDGYC